VLGRTLDELPPQTRRLLSTLHGWVGEQCQAQGAKRSDYRFTRRQVRALTGWGDTQLKIHLARLAELEYLLTHRVRQGQGFEYELLYTGEGEDGGRFLMGLADLGNYGYDGQRSGQNAARSAPGRAAVGGQSAPGRPDADSREARQEAASQPIPANGSKKARLPGTPASRSYPQPSLAA
jgi:DNA primase